MFPNVGNLPDARSREIIGDALNWALANPENFSTYMRGKSSRYGHSPNFVAFTNLLDGIERTSKRWGRPVREIVHDGQSQFKKTLVEWHAIVSRPDLVGVEPIRWPGEVEPHYVSKTSGSNFRMATEETSAGLQVIDVVLWLFKRMTDGKSIGQNSERLMQWVLQRAYQHDFSFDGVGDQADKTYRTLMSAVIPSDQERGGIEYSLEEEALRMARIADYAASKAGKKSTE